MDNDYTRLADDLRQAIHVTESVNDIDPDIQAKVDEAKDLLEEAKAMAEARA